MAQTDAEYEAALAAITDNGVYYVKTNVSSTYYYLKDDGTLTSSKSDAAYFIFQKTKGEYKEYGFKLNNNGKYFSNPASSGNINDTKLNTSTRGDDSWEAQAFFLKEGKYAIRTCNVLPAESGWNHVGSAFWTVKIGDVTTAGYDWDPNYCWELEIDETKTQQSLAYETASNWPFKIQAASGYIKDASQYYSNAKQTSEGTYEAMLDGVYSSYFHSCWSNGPSEDHYLQIELTDPVQEYQFYYKKRHSNNNNRPTKIVISASNDGKSFTEIKTIDSGLPTDEKVLDYVSDVIDLGAAYKYVRYTVPTTNNGAANNGHVFFTFSEFYMLPVKEIFQNAMNIYKQGKARFSLTSEDIAKINQIEDDLNNAMIDVTYQVSFNGKIVATESAQSEPNTAPSLPESLKRDFVSFSDPDIAVITKVNNVVTYTATWDESVFKLSTDYENAKWQNMVMRATWYVTTDQKDGDGAYKTVNANAYGLGTDAYQWAFIGNPWEGFKILNKAEAGKSFGFTEDQKINQGIPTFLPEDEGEHIWRIAKSTSGVGKFYLNVPGTNLYINQYGGAGGSVKFWNSASNVSDAGSSFTVFDIPTDFSEYVASEIAPAIETEAKYFVFTDAAKAAIGYDPAYKTECSYNAYKSMKDKLAAALSDVTNFVLPESGVYFLKNKNNPSKGLMGMDPSDANMYGDYAAIKDARNYVTLTKVGEKTYTISLMGKYAPATVAQSQPVKATTEANTYTVVITKPGYAAFQADPESNMSCLHRRSEGDIVGWEAAADASMWEAIDATSVKYEIKEEGYATAYLPFPVNFEEAVSVTVPEAKGVWTFDNPENPMAGKGTATMGATGGVTIADGVVTVPVGDKLIMNTNANATELKNYTFMMDIMVPADKGSDESLNPYTALFQNKPNNDDDGSFFIYWHKTNGRKIGVNSGGLGYGGSIELGTWYRVVFVSNNSTATVYVNGEKTGAATSAVGQHWTLKDRVLFFADNDGEENLVKTSEIRFWDQPLTAEQVAVLSTVGTNDMASSSETGVKAYSGKINGNYLTLNEINGIVPEKTPVVLKGNPGTYSFLIPKDILGLPHIENDLKGTLEPIDATGKYVLAQPEGEKIGFYLANEGEIAATKAYIDRASNTGPLVKAFYFNGDGTTSINSLTPALSEGEGAIYNIAGQRINKLQKGINIVNGKKILK